jgi:hypothetical protein
MTFTAAALIAAWIAILVLALALAGVLQQMRALVGGSAGAPRLAVGPIVGRPAPPLDGRAVPAPALILFADRDCPSCHEVAPAFGLRGNGSIRKVLVYEGDAPPAYHGIDTLVVDRATFDQWNVRVTPFLAAVDEAGTVVSAAPVGSAPVLERHLKAIEEEAHLASLE